jgi:hypothetical protein
MSEDAFTDTGETREDWVDVRMTNPDEGEWDVDVIVVGGKVEYVDLRIRPELLASFVECLIDDIGEERADAIVREVAERRNLKLDLGAEDRRS